MDLSGLFFNDLETFNAVHDLREVGPHVYAQTAEIILCSYALGEAPTQLWTVEDGPFPVSLKNQYRKAKRKVAHNAFFEQCMLDAAGIVPWDPSQWHCTMAQAFAHSMPGALDALCRYLDVPQEKRKKGEGQRLIRMFCKLQRDGRRLRKRDAPIAWESFCQYSIFDNEALREVFRRLPQMNLNPFGPPVERALWELDQRINRRGIQVDLDLARQAIVALKAEKKELDEKVEDITLGAVTSATQRERVLVMLKSMGLNITNLRSATVQYALDDKDLQGEIRELLAARRSVSKASTGKYKTCIVGADDDGRMRGTLQFAGAKRTARWAGRRFQPHNMPRPKRKWPQIQEGIKAIKLGAAHLIEDDVHSLCSDVLRSLIVAGEGSKLVVADENAIEGRVLAWLADETWKLDLYRDPDADMYVGTYNKVFGRDPRTEISGDQRQQGKVFELSMGYEGGVGALVASATTYRVDLPTLGESAWAKAPLWAKEKAWDLYHRAIEREGSVPLPKKLYIQLEAVKVMWRAAAPETVRLWKKYDKAAALAVGNKGQKYHAGRCTFLCRGRYLYCRLPSGRFLLYRDPKIREGKITYAADYGGRVNMYGGKWAENIVQSLARDVLGHAMLLADKKGFEIVLTVHDEIIAEGRKPQHGIEQLKQLMTITPSWADGLPLKAAGYEADRYRKD